MKCDRCGEQLPIADGIDYCGQTLCLECALRGCNPSCVQHTELLQDENINEKTNWNLVTKLEV